MPDQTPNPLTFPEWRFVVALESEYRRMRLKSPSAKACWFASRNGQYERAATPSDGRRAVAERLDIRSPWVVVLDDREGCMPWNQPLVTS